VTTKSRKLARATRTPTSTIIPAGVYRKTKKKTDRQTNILQNLKTVIHWVIEITRKISKREILGPFPFDQKFRFEISGIPYDEWTGIFRFVEPTRPRPSRSKFRAKIQTVKQGKMCWPLLLELFDDSEVESDG